MQRVQINLVRQYSNATCTNKSGENVTRVSIVKITSQCINFIHYESTLLKNGTVRHGW